MQIKDGMLDDWNKTVANNQDSYGSAVIRYIERWTDMLENEIASSELPPKEVIDKFAEQTSHDADTEGITGFMYGCAVSIISQVWAYGEELRVWHNKDYGYEGDGVVNPAILTVSM